MNSFIFGSAVASLVTGALLSLRFGVRTLALASIMLAVPAAGIWLTGFLQPFDALGGYLLSVVGLQIGYGAALWSRALFARKPDTRRGESRSV